MATYHCLLYATSSIKGLYMTSQKEAIVSPRTIDARPVAPPPAAPPEYFT